ncbi:hypothetical protein [Paracraurococcus lichenis]|uniref:Uncharacterized protein n=1 Tax=Paracraurococcus lichenis TaxID=3064888 RepID=A0ABT9E238_9PROT|nr:hypothetical protein [Paracraurococcus sp. LOR1-02]MDO9710215.1 hypothetical protein [Paracraurococcus sp. LOR1-02]
MTDFVIVVATLAALAAPGPVPAKVPLDAPTIGFRLYGDLAACERAVAAAVAPAGRRLVCLPVAAPETELANAY